MKNIQFCWVDYGMEMENEILKKGKVGKRGTINVFHKMKGELPRKTLGNPLWFSHNRAEKNSNCIVKEIKSQGLR